MAEYTEQKTSAQLEREVEQQRARVENRISDIQEKLSPGQMVDELFNYAKNNGGGDFVANLGKNVSGNPLPVALIGISLLWLIAKPASTAQVPAPPSRVWDDRPEPTRISREPSYRYGYATVTGGVRRLRIEDTTEGRHSEFVDEFGKRFRALTDAAGNRAGHFIDDAGQTFAGFKDIAGNKVEDIRDETGSVLDAASGWASDTWQKASDAVGKIGDTLSDRRDQLQQRASDAGSAVQHQADQMSRTLMHVLHDQPLVGGALAFAVGAAVASAFPHTRQEDQVFGEAADKLKQQVGSVASDAYDKGKEQVTDAYEKVTDKAAEVYQQAKDGIANSIASADNSAPTP
jgi:ElaB/YqjD/DUF883 family membrane-anchored ribosome-binding protein